jgi:cysteine synthase
MTTSQAVYVVLRIGTSDRSSTRAVSPAFRPGIWESCMPVHQSVLELIGNTPIVKARRIDSGPCELFFKLESANPGGSIKDRIGLSMIEGAERAGKIKPGDTLVEGTAGNTGIGLALVAQQKGYRLILVVPDKMSREKIFNLKAMGAEVVLTRSDVAKGHPQYYQDLAERLARETPGAYFINQFGNPDNPRAHEETTGPESSGKWTAGSMRSCSAAARPARCPASRGISPRPAPNVELILADPVGSILAQYINEGHAVDEVGLVDGRRHRRGLPAADLGFLASEESLRDQRQGKLSRRPRPAGEGRHSRRLVDRDAAGGGTEILPRADHAQARARAGVRHRQQVSVEDVQRLLDARQRLPRAAATPAICAI